MSMRADVSMDLESAIWQHLEQTRMHDPTQMQFQRPDMFGSGNTRYDSRLVSEIQSGYTGVSFDLLDVGFAEVISDLDHQVIKEPVKRTRGRRRATESGNSDGWVASKNLISERKRREKLKEGLLTLRGLVPIITKMDKVSILADAINYLQDLKRTIEMLETNLDSHDGDQSCPDLKALEGTKSSCTDLEISEAENEGDTPNNSSSDDSCSVRFDEVVSLDYQTTSSSRDWNLHQIQLDVTKLDHGMYKLDLICKQQSGVLVQLSRAIEAFVIEIVHTSIVVITSTKVTCTFVVKMSSWNDMTLEDVRTDVKQLLGQSGLQF